MGGSSEVAASDRLYFQAKLMGENVSQLLVSSPWILGVALVVVAVVLQRVMFGSKSKKLNLPPVPRGYPILGTMLTTRGPQTHKVLYSYVKDHGTLFALKTGLKYFIVVMSSDDAYEALIKKAQIYSTRPRTVARMNFNGRRSVNAALYGDYWRAVRKNLVSELASSSRVATFKPFRETELNNLMERIREQGKKNNNVVSVLQDCRITVFSILLRVLFGRTFEPEVMAHLSATLRRLIILMSPQVIDFLPFVQIFNKKHRNECQKHLGEMKKLFVPLIEEHRELFNKGETRGDYVDSLLRLQKEMNLVESDLLGLIGEVLTGGTDTTSNTLEWTMAELVQNQDMQARLYEEIKSVRPDGTPVSEEDIEKMPYLQAIAKESLRRHPPLPFGLVHGVTEQTTLRGYDVPEDAMILLHIQAMQRDPQRWDQPMVFNPDRFMNNNPNHDMTGSHGPRSLDLMPFGAGRRICPAMNLGLKHVHLITARLIQNFEWTTVNPGEDVDLTEHLETTIVMTTPLLARVRERSAI